MSRTAFFTSSSIWKLTKRAKNGKDFGAPALTYIKEKQMELRLGRGITNDFTAKETSWGNLCEPLAFNLIGQEWQLVSQVRDTHPTITNWSGAKDLISPTKVGDIKCCFTLKRFCELVDCFGDIDMLKDIAEDYYWQLVSNAILSNRDIAELIIYCPYKRELQSIRKSVEDIEGDTSEFNWIKYTTDDQLPYLIEGKHYKNINHFQFEVPQADKEFLIESVQMAVNKLHGL